MDGSTSNSLTQIQLAVQVGANGPVPGVVKRHTVVEERIHHLCKIRGLDTVKDFWRVAEEEWEKHEKKFGGRVELKKAQVLAVTNEIYQLVGFSAAFQGLLITAASQASRLTCQTKWTVLVLSVFATVVTATGVWEKNKIIEIQQEAIAKEEPTRRGFARRVESLRKFGPDSFDFDQIIDSEARPRPSRNQNCFQVSASNIEKYWSYGYIVFYCLIIFGLLCALSMHYILCDKSAQACPPCKSTS